MPGAKPWGFQRAFVCAGMLLLAAPAWATHDEPGKGRTGKAVLVTAYEPCTSPNTTTSGLTPFPACSPPVRTDPVCGFGALSVSPASGKVKARTRNFDVDITMQAKGLSAGCEGRSLCGVATVRVTTDRCEIAPCTVMDLVDVRGLEPSACCVVTKGICKVHTSINNQIFDALRAGERAGIEILGCGLVRVDGTDPPSSGHTFSCGLLAP